MEERLLTLLESVLGHSKKTSGNNYAFFSPFVEHYKQKLEINIGLNSNGNNPWHCWISDEKGKTIRSLFRKLKVSKDVWDEHNSIFSRKYRYNNDQATDQATDQDNRLERVLQFCTLPRSRMEIQEFLGLKHRRSFKETVLQPLLESGLLIQTIPDKPSSPNQRYITRNKQKGNE